MQNISDEQFVGFVDTIVKREVCYNNIYMADTLIGNLKTTLEITSQGLNFEVVKDLLREDIALLEDVKNKSQSIVQVAEEEYSKLTKELSEGGL